MSIEIEGIAHESHVRTFPTPDSRLARILNDHEFRKTFGGALKKSNPFVVVFYRLGLLPLFGASRNLMILTTRGCGSGKFRQTPIGFFRVGGAVHIFSAWGRSSGWYKNLIANPEDVQLQIGLRRRKVRAHALEDPDEIWSTVQQLMQASPKIARYLFGWDPAADRIDPYDFSEVIHKVLIVRFDDL